MTSTDERDPTVCPHCEEKHSINLQEMCRSMHGPLHGMAEPTPDEREAFYDEEIAPALLELADRCLARGMPFIAVVEWAPNQYGRTTGLPASPPSASMGLIYGAALAQGNIDALVIAMARHAREHGHNSLVLSVMGRR